MNIYLIIDKDDNVEGAFSTLEKANEYKKKLIELNCKGSYVRMIILDEEVY